MVQGGVGYTRVVQGGVGYTRVVQERVFWSRRVSQSGYSGPEGCLRAGYQASLGGPGAGQVTHTGVTERARLPTLVSRSGPGGP